MTSEHLITANLRPGLCLVRPIDEHFSDTLVKPDRVDMRQGYGEVVAVGKNGCDPGFCEGDYVIFDRHCGEHIACEEQELVLVAHRHILAVVE